MGKRINQAKRGSKRPDHQLDWQLEGLLQGKTSKVSLQLGYQSYEEEYRNRAKNQPSRSQKPRRSNSDSATKVHLTGLSYINAHYQFVVDPSQIGPAAALDPNVPPPKQSVVCVVANDTHFTCPICLSDEIVSPRMIVHCGHVMCLKCLLSLLDSEVPPAKKREAKSVVEKYRECPLCSCIIRSHEVLPVSFSQIPQILPKPGVEVEWTLMSRPHNRSVALPKELSIVHDYMVDFPEAGGEPSELEQHSRIIKGSLQGMLDMYAAEKEAILTNHAVEKELYGEGDKYVTAAIKHIDAEVSDWMARWSEMPTRVTPLEPATANPFLFYQLGSSHGGTVYVLAPLDVKVVKSAFDDSYANLPSTITAPVENVSYEELSPEKSVGRWKFLAHLPLGTQIGFVECDWSKHPIVSASPDFKQYEADLIKRSKRSQSKSKREERNRQKALAWEEQRTRDFYERENSGIPPEAIDDYIGGGLGMGSLSIIDRTGTLPELTAPAPKPEEDPNKYKKSVWGTTVLKSEEEDMDELEAAEMIRKAREAMETMERSGKQKKKKRIVLSSTL
ncbi:hypothetical protein DIURU_002236 [Diutina rugosa]|uniref:RING-type domain-containing protein n=1 Tax=Diutina rugosa TaxID=5481 RepID=A0A642UXE2_DIURU|nr:uncharacterized protein DIURU_002236 [Diutina rugosa]KAA8903724.1 hypothetical protein DIURU_002236 [Diutina rugosa]